MRQTNITHLRNIDGARDFAALFHRGQFRKYRREPYTAHTDAVAGLVASVGGTPAMVMAAHLHDVLEDTPALPEQIFHLFGWEVRYMVAALTDAYTVDDLPWMSRRERKQREHARLAKCDSTVQTIKLADMLDNSLGIASHDPKFAAVYLPELRHLHGLLDKGNPTLRYLLGERLKVEESILAEQQAA